MVHTVGSAADHLLYNVVSPRITCRLASLPLSRRPCSRGPPSERSRTGCGSHERLPLPLPRPGQMRGVNAGTRRRRGNADARAASRAFT